MDICIDGAQAMTGKTAGAVSRINSKASDWSSSQYILHRQALALRKWPPNLKKKKINFVKSGQL